MILKVTDGTTTITLSGSGLSTAVVGAIYFPRTPEDEIQHYERSLSDGQSVGDVRMTNVVESALVTLAGSAVNIRATHLSLTRLLRRASRKLSPVWVEYDPTGGGTPWRSAIFAARIFWPEDKALRQLGQTSNVVQFTVIWEREPFWTLATWSEVQISAHGQAAATGGRTIYNHNDSGHGNWFEVAAAQIGGDLPGPVRVDLVNASGQAVFYRNFYIGVRSYASGTFAHALEGEAANAGSAIASGAASNGYYLQYSASGTSVLLWDLPAATVRAGEGGRHKILLLLSSGSNPAIYVTPQLRDLYGLTVLWQGDQIYLPAQSSKLIDMGRPAPLPPDGPGLWGDMVFALALDAPSAATFQLDFIQLIPTSSYRHLIMRGTSVGAAGGLSDDNEANRAWWADASGQIGVFSTDDRTLMVEPGLNNRFYLLCDRSGGTAPIDEQFSVRLYYKPRRVTV